jgi:hypothetical protein
MFDLVNWVYAISIIIATVTIWMSAPSSSSSNTAILVIDLEVTGHGFDMELNRIMGGAMVVIELGKSINQTLTQEDLLALIPEDNRFYEYVHDSEALFQIKSILKSGDTQGQFIWKEFRGREFWLKPDNREQLLTAVDKMKRSDLGPCEFSQAARDWIHNMASKYNNLILLSDTSNFDWKWLDSYLHKHAGRGSVNYATRNGCVMPMDATSYFFGLSKQAPSFQAWDNFSSAKSLKEAGFTLPDTSKVIDPNSHHPLDDAINIAIRFASIANQLQAK